MTATIKDIAKRAGVSISTASNVLNNKTGIIKASPETCRRIMAAAEELDYSPSIMARGLRSGKSSLIGMMAPSIHESFFPEILQGIEDVLNQNNYNMILCTYKNISEFHEKWKTLHSKQVDGIITPPMQDKAFSDIYLKIKEKMPLVFTTGKAEGLDIPYVYVPPSAIAATGATYLLQNGHRNIGVIRQRGDEFINTFISEIKKYSDSSCIISDLGKPEEIVSELITKSRGRKKITALMASNDEIAAKIIYEATKSGVRIPEDISILGVDDLPVCKLTMPNITTIAQPRYEQGSIAAQILLDMIDKKGKLESMELHPIIIERESCRKIKSRRDS